MVPRVVAVLGAGATLVVGLLVAPSGAGAFGGGEHGVLRMHGPGSAFTGSQADASQVVAGPGSTGTFALQVKNNGTATAQFNLTIAQVGQTCSDSCATATDTLSAGSLIVTPLAHGPNGYFTGPIAPGRTGAFTFKVVTPRAPGSVAGDGWQYEILLSDTAGNLLDEELALVFNKVATGTGSADAYVSASGTAATTMNLSAGEMAVTAPVVAVGGTATFTVKLKNDSTTPGPISFEMDGLSSCSSFFTEHVLAGSTDVTSAVLSDTYSTKTLTHGASVTLSVKIKYLASATACLAAVSPGGEFVDDVAVAVGGSDFTEIFLIVDVAAEN